VIPQQFLVSPFSHPHGLFRSFRSLVLSLSSRSLTCFYLLPVLACHSFTNIATVVELCSLHALYQYLVCDVCDDHITESCNRLEISLRTIVSSIIAIIASIAISISCSNKIPSIGYRIYRRLFRSDIKSFISAIVALSTTQTPKSAVSLDSILRLDAIPPSGGRLQPNLSLPRSVTD
jgi:hypothetical protein